MKPKTMTTAFLSIALCLSILAGCSSLNNNNTSGSTTSNAISSPVTSNLTNSASADKFIANYNSEDYYFNWKSQSHTTINLSSGSADITKSGVYELTGKLTDGSVTVNLPSSDSGIVYLVLNGASISSKTSAPIYVKDAKKVVILLESGTTNTIYQGSGVVTDEDGDPSAAIFSKADLTITGSGTLNVTSDYNDAITCKDTLKITGGTINIKAASDGIVGKDVLAVKDGNITITAGKDGMRSTNEVDMGLGKIIIEGGSFVINSSNDALQAYGILQVEGGIFSLTTGGGYTGVTKTGDTGGMGGQGFPGGQGFQTNTGTMPAQGGQGAIAAQGGTPPDMTQETPPTQGAAGTIPAQQSAVSTETETESAKALKSGTSIIINGGDFTISSTDDALNSNSDISINGGSFTIESGDDGIHANNSITITAGTINIKNCYEAIESVKVTVSGGKIDINAKDDGINIGDTSGLLTISGGNIYILSGGDSLDSNNKIVMTGGTVYLDGPASGPDSAIDYDNGFNISGGTIIGASSKEMAETGDSTSSQLSILMYYSSTQAAKTKVSLKNSSGNVVAEFTPAKQFNSIAISVPALKKGESYTLYSGDTATVSFTISDTVTFLTESGITTDQSRHVGTAGGAQAGGRQRGM